MNLKLKQDIIAAVGEFIGTVFFIFLALGGVQAALSVDTLPKGPSPDQILSVAFSFGFSLLVSLWAFGGGVLNPAVLFSLVLTKNISVVRGALYLFAELAGATVGAGLIHAVTPGPLLGVNSLGNGITSIQATFLEAICTSILILTVFFLAIEKSKSNFLAPIGIGFSVFVAHLIETPWTGTSINPARSFGAAVVAGNFTSDHWVFWVGPIIGSVIGTAIYKFTQYSQKELLISMTESTSSDSTLPSKNEVGPVPLEAVEVQQK